MEPLAASFDWKRIALPPRPMGIIHPAGSSWMDYALMITRRSALAGASLLPFGARAQAKYPDRPVKLIIPWTAGGPADGGFRILAESAAKKLGQPVVVE